MFACACAQFANPPWNQPQVRPFAFSRSPTFWPPISAVDWVVSQLSNQGRSSPKTVPGPCGATTPGWFAVENSVAHFGALIVDEPPQMAPNVLPLTRFSAPGLDGPYPVLNELSLIEKCCA